MGSKLYTFMMEFNGGTYISQVSASDPCSALEVWARALDPEAIEGLCDSVKAELVQGVSDETPTPIEGLQNVWCVFLNPGGARCLVHLVETA